MNGERLPLTVYSLRSPRVLARLHAHLDVRSTQRAAWLDAGNQPGAGVVQPSDPPEVLRAWMTAHPEHGGRAARGGTTPKLPFAGIGYPHVGLPEVVVGGRTGIWGRLEAWTSGGQPESGRTIGRGGPPTEVRG